MRHKEAPPYGLLPSTTITILVLAVYFTIHIATIAALAGYEGERVGYPSGLNHATGFMVSISILISVPVCLALLRLFMKLRSREYISFYINPKLPSPAQAAKWLLITLVAEAIYMTITVALHRPMVNDFVRYVYETSYSMPLFILMIGFMGPLFEESLFRGFLLRCAINTPLGWLGASVYTSVLWAGIHLQYDLIDMGYVLTLGILFSLARIKTGSITLPLMMHSLNNILSIVISHYYLRGAQ